MKALWSKILLAAMLIGLLAGCATTGGQGDDLAGWLQEQSDLSGDQ